MSCVAIIVGEFPIFVRKIPTFAGQIPMFGWRNSKFYGLNPQFCCLVSHVGKVFPFWIEEKIRNALGSTTKTCPAISVMWRCNTTSASKKRSGQTSSRDAWAVPWGAWAMVPSVIAG